MEPERLGPGSDPSSRLHSLEALSRVLSVGAPQAESASPRSLLEMQKQLSRHLPFNQIPGILTQVKVLRNIDLRPWTSHITNPASVSSPVKW